MMVRGGRSGDCDDDDDDDDGGSGDESGDTSTTCPLLRVVSMK